MIEKEFTIVLYVDNKFEGKNPIYSFNTVLENSSAKCPPDIISDFSIDNDCNLVLEKIKEFVK